MVSVVTHLSITFESYFKPKMIIYSNVLWYTRSFILYLMISVYETYLLDFLKAVTCLQRGLIYNNIVWYSRISCCFFFGSFIGKMSSVLLYCFDGDDYTIAMSFVIRMNKIQIYCTTYYGCKKLLLPWSQVLNT